jgi:transposase-like protein
MHNNYLYTIRYRPNTNPIEGFFNQLKHYIKLRSPLTYEEILKQVNHILKHDISKENLQNYVKYLFLRAIEFTKKYKEKYEEE